MVTLHRIWDVEHHRAGRIDHVVAVAKICPEPLTSERHREIVPWLTLNGCLHPYDAAGTGISFQGRNSCRVRSDELKEERVVPIKNYDAIIAEVNCRQVFWRKLSVRVAVRSDSVLNKRMSPWIVRFEQREFICRGLAQSKRVLNRVAGKLRAPRGLKPTAG